MRFAFVVCVVAMVVGCAKKQADDKCQAFIDRSMKVLGEIAALRGATLGDAEKKQLVQQCKKAVKAGHPDPAMACVLGSTDDNGVRACYIKSYEQYMERSKEIEARLQLGKLGKNAKTAFGTNAEFPKGKVGPTPATPCCNEPAKHCTGTPEQWRDPVWIALDFTVEGTFSYQYTYESDGKTFTATATGDIGCTGKPTTTTITGKVGADGAPEVGKP